MPSSTLDVLLDRYALVSHRNRMMMERFAVVAQALHQAGVPFLLLKGADVLTRLYGIRGTRPLCDIDVLVRERDLPAVHALMDRLDCFQQIDGNPSYRSADDAFALDIVTDLWYLDQSALAALWARAITLPMFGLSVARLGTEDLLIHLTAYAVVHRGHVSAAFVQDVRLLVEKEAPDWTMVIGRARAYGLAVPLHHGFTYVNTVVRRQAIPAHVCAALAPASWRERRFAWFVRCLVTATPVPEIGHLLLPMTLPAPRAIRWLMRTCCPTAEFWRYRYGVASARPAWRMRGRRFLHLAASGVRLAGRIACRVSIPERFR